MIKSQCAFEFVLFSSDLIDQKTSFLKSDQGTVIDVSELSQGVYFLKIVIDGKQKTERIIICD